jgi:hypothetical protein
MSACQTSLLRASYKKKLKKGRKTKRDTKRAIKTNPRGKLDEAQIEHLWG